MGCGYHTVATTPSSGRGKVLKRNEPLNVFVCSCFLRYLSSKANGRHYPLIQQRARTDTPNPTLAGKKRTKIEQQTARIYEKRKEYEVLRQRTTFLAEEAW